MVAAMMERRTLLALLLVAVTVALYIWGKQSANPPDKPTPPEKAEAEERAKADPFPAPQPAPK
jgi:hypothetical protein